MAYRWTIKLFAGLPERFGVSSITVEHDTDRLSASELKRLLSSAYPEHAGLIGIAFIACNHAYSNDDTMLNAADELALLPPVSGGEEPAETEENGRYDLYVITADPIRESDVLAKVVVPAHGAALVFVGTTREWTHGKRTVKLEYEAYVPMAVATMKQIGDEIAERWPGALCAITHRIGVVGLAETSVAIAVSAPHRDSCYEASRYAIERLKQIVPIWKKEIWEDGSEWKGHQLGPWNPTAPLSDF